MKAETYRRKAEELDEKIENTNPRFKHKIEAMEAEKERLERKAEEREEYERSLEGDDENEDEYDYEEDDDEYDDDDDYEEDDDEYDDDDDYEEEDDEYDDDDDYEEEEDDDDDDEVTIEEIRKNPENFCKCIYCGKILKKSNAIHSGFYFCCDEHCSQYMNENQCEYSCGTCLLEESPNYGLSCGLEEIYSCDYYKEHDDKPYIIVPKPSASQSSCIYCNRKGICKNEDSRHYYDQECPGDCVDFYHE